MPGSMTINYFRDSLTGHFSLTIDPGNGLPPRTFEVTLPSSKRDWISWSEPGFSGVFQFGEHNIETRPSVSVPIAVAPELQSKLLTYYQTFSDLANNITTVDYDILPSIQDGINCGSFVNAVEALRGQLRHSLISL